ncbi:MAG: prolyl oligopeptidase family serine peptidase [Pseudomonadota bacterium]
MQWPHSPPPNSKRVKSIQVLPGRTLEDPYAWLKEESSETSDWINEQRTYTNCFFADDSQCDLLIQQMQERLSNVRGIVLPHGIGNRFFGLRREQLVEFVDHEIRLIVRIPGAHRIIDGDSHGTRIAVAMTDSTDNVELQLVDTATGHIIGETVSLGQAYLHEAGVAVVSRQALFHVYRKSWADPVSVIHRNAEGQVDTWFTHGPAATIRLSLSPDERWLVMMLSEGESSTQLYLRDLQGDNQWHQCASEVDARITVFWLGQRLLLQTSWQAPNGRLLSLLPEEGLEQPCTAWLAESDAPILHISVASNRVFVGYLRNVQTQVSIFDESGQSLGTVPSIGQATQSPMFGSSHAAEAAFTASTYNDPATLFWYDIKTNTVLNRLRSNDTVITQQIWFDSKDGTKIPMTILHQRDVEMRNAPTVLYGYGGWGSAVFPWYDPFIAHWISLGGIYAVANIRGGSEFGQAWHEAGRLLNKNNVFDDFIGAARWFIEQGISTPKRLGIRGFSNGGLLMGVMLTRYPEMWAAVSAHIAPFDQTDFEVNPSVKLELGDPADPVHLGNLLSYTPYYHVREGEPYPAVMITAGAEETRIPAHDCLRMTARLQMATASQAPILLRLLEGVGHGMNRMAMPIERQARIDGEELAFFCRALDVVL